MAFSSPFYYINVPVAEMREKSQQDSEVVSQAFFSEAVNALENEGDWIKIETLVDKYQGWIKKAALCQRQKPYPPLSSPFSASSKVNRCAAHVYHLQDTTYGPIFTLPFESQLECSEYIQDSNSRWIKISLPDGRTGYIQRGDVTFDCRLLNREEMCNLSLSFLGLPYTWGGRSSFGYDCSGFVQMLYRQRGVYLPRDSKEQILCEEFTPISVENLLPGDLIFFGLSEDKIRHVGMSLGDNQFIHSTVQENAPYIRISKLSDPEWNGSGTYSYRALLHCQT